MGAVTEAELRQVLETLSHRLTRRELVSFGRFPRPGTPAHLLPPPLFRSPARPARCSRCGPAEGSLGA